MKFDGNRQREFAAWMWNNGGAQMTAAIALGVVVIAVFLSVQSGSVLKDLIAGFGAVGQVFFAGKVWQLSERQFEFTKYMSAEQNRINQLPTRQALLNSFNENHSALSGANVHISMIDHLDDLVKQSRTLFNDTTYNLIVDYAASARNVKQIDDMADIFATHADPTTIPTYFKYKRDAQTEFSKRWVVAHEAIVVEMKRA